MPKKTLSRKPSSALKNRLADLERVAIEILKGKTHKGTVQEYDRPDRILLDYDTNPRKYAAICEDLRRLGLRPLAVYYSPSSTRGHWHVVLITRRPMALAWRLFVQVYLGSDHKREGYNFVRAYHYGRRDRYVQVLFGEKIP